MKHPLWSLRNDLFSLSVFPSPDSLFSSMCDLNTDNPSLNKYTRLYVCFLFCSLCPARHPQSSSIHTEMEGNPPGRKTETEAEECASGKPNRRNSSLTCRSSSADGNRSHSPMISPSLFCTSLLLPPFQPFSPVFPWVLPSLSLSLPPSFFTRLRSFSSLLPGLSSSPSPLYPALSLRLLFFVFFGFSTHFHLLSLLLCTVAFSFCPFLPTLDSRTPDFQRDTRSFWPTAFPVQM